MLDRHLARDYDGQYAEDRYPSEGRSFYLELARRTGGPVMEVGWGTGCVREVGNSSGGGYRLQDDVLCVDIGDIRRPDNIDRHVRNWRCLRE